jgi:hypothetical protein
VSLLPDRSGESIDLSWDGDQPTIDDVPTRPVVLPQWPTIEDWARGQAVPAPTLVVELRDALTYFGGTHPSPQRYIAARPDDLDCSCGSAAGEPCKGTAGVFRKRPRCPERNR